MTPTPNALFQENRHRNSGVKYGFRRATAALAAVALTGAGLVLAPSASAALGTPVTGQEAVSMVNTFIGSQEDGNTFPGATVPFGMVQLSPDNGHNVGYDYGNNAVRGFSQVHVSGVGCGIAGFVPILPTTDAITNQTDYSSSSYSRSVKRDGSNKKVESARPGYYTTTLTSGSDNDIKAELTATERTGLQKYTFTSTNASTKSYVRINAGQALSQVRSSKVSIDPINRIVRTESVAYRFCQDTPDFTVYTTTKFNQDFDAFGTWVDNALTASSESAASTKRTGAQLTFPRNATVEFQTALSYVSAAGADANLAAEASTFAAADSAATATWAAQLGKVAVTQGVTNAPTEAARTTQLRVFYSALYRSFVAPNVGSDVDGKYRGWDRQVHDVTTDIGAGSKYYQYFSLWDTYRTQQQWLYLTEPTRSQDQMRSLILQGEQSGWLPRWGYGPVETNVMTGDPGTPFLVSAWDQGLIKGEWAERAYAVLKHNADNSPAPEAFENGRAGNPVYLKDGYVPFDPSAKTRDTDYDLDHGGSATLEYALADATLSKMAAGLGHTEDAVRYAQRGQNYRSIWDDENKTFRSRDANGLYVEETRPEHIDGFHEGTAAQYEWLVQQDVPGLINLMGGTSATVDRLDEFFAYDSIDLATRPGTVARNQIPGTVAGDRKGWVDGTYAYYGWKTYNPNNEPDLHAPYIYQWVGQPYKTTDVVREALTLFRDAPNGVTGNDDLGTMAAWQVLSTIGIFPIMPGKDVWGLTTPVFDQVDIKLEPAFFNGKTKLTIKSTGGVSMTNRYTQSVKVGAANENKSFITGSELTGAGTIDFTVGSGVSNWGTTSSPGALLPNTPTIATNVSGGVRNGQTVVNRNSTGTAELTLMVRGAATVAGTASVSAPAGITASFSGGGAWSVSPNGGTKQTTVGASIAVGNIGAGTYPISWSLTTDAGTSTVTSNVVVPEKAPSKLVDSFNNKAIGDGGVADSAKFNHTEGGSGEFFLRERMAAAGLAPNQRHALKSDSTLGYVLTDKGTGTSNMDNVLAQGQTIDVEGDYVGATKISFVGSVNNGPAAPGLLVITYTDGTVQPISDYGFTDWCSGNPQTSGNVIEGKVSGRWGGSSIQNLGCSLWSTKVYPLAEGKSLKSIKLPNAPKHHLFAIATNAAVTASGPLTLTGSLAIEGPGQVVTASIPAFNAASGAEIYKTGQWLLAGEPVQGATGTSFVLETADIGKTLQYEVTAVSDGLNPLKLTTAPAKIQGTLTNVTAPEISGAAQAGKTLTATPGTYSLADVSASYQWLADGTEIAGATASTLNVGNAHVGKKISVRVTASQDNYGSVETTSAATAAVIAAPIVTPPSVTVTKKPVVKGSAQVGKTVTASGAAFSPSGTKVSYQWLRNGTPIVGATKAKYTVVAKDNKKKLSVRVTAKKAGLVSAVATSSATKAVKAGTFKVTKNVSIKGTAKVGKKLKANKAKFSVSGVKVKYNWLRNGKTIKGATKSTYKISKKDRSKKISVKITASKSAYSTVKSTSKKTSKIR